MKLLGKSPKSKPRTFEERADKIGLYAKYLGGHPAYPKKALCRIFARPDQLEITDRSFNLKIPYARIERVEKATKRGTNMDMVALFGVLGLIAKGDLMVLRVQEADGNTYDLFFGDVQYFNQVLPLIYNRMMETKTANASPV